MMLSGNLDVVPLPPSQLDEEPTSKTSVTFSGWSITLANFEMKEEKDSITKKFEVYLSVPFFLLT